MDGGGGERGGQSQIPADLGRDYGGHDRDGGRDVGMQRYQCDLSFINANINLKNHVWMFQRSIRHTSLAKQITDVSFAQQGDLGNLVEIVTLELAVKDVK